MAMMMSEATTPISTPKMGVTETGSAGGISADGGSVMKRPVRTELTEADRRLEQDWQKQTGD